MTRNKVTLMLSLFLITALSACNLPSAQGTPTPDIDLTVTAQLQLLDTATPGVPTETATPEFTAAPDSTSTPSVPTVTVSINTNCRTGPSTQYELIGGLNVGQSAEVVGKSTSTGYWIIRTPGGGTCWLWGQYATVSGNTANLPEYPIPPTPTPSVTPTPTPPAPVENVSMVMVCIPVGLNFNHSGVLSWEDKSNNEDGFNIYMNGALIASIPANSTSYNIPPTGPFIPGIASIFGVEAFNATGKAIIKTVTRGCP